MLKRTLACAFLIMTGHAYSADIQVTTLLDEKNYTGCSLRNAVEFLNKRSQKEYENGYQGCGDKDSSSTIILQRDKEYTLNSAIHIKAGMAIMTAASGSFNDNQKGMHNATIKMVGNDRLFVINDESVEETLLPVIFVELNLKGSAYKVTDGGLIFNREALSIQYSRLTGGNAVRGGAIYNAGTVTNEQTTASLLNISNSLLQGNKADQGAVIYSEMPLYLITQSVIRDNEGTQGENGALLYSQTAFTDKTTAGVLASRVSGLRNSTIFHNKGGYVANIRGGMLLNNVTIIRNAAGLFLQAPKRVVAATKEGEKAPDPEPSAYISNSIIVANEANNCASSANDEAVIQSNLTTAECDRNAPVGSPNFFIGNNKLIAGGTNDEGECAAPPADGLLCPYYTPKDQMLGYFKPRLLMSYTKLSDSLIVNKGRIYSDGTTAGFAKSCEGSDQRGKPRSGYDELCDLGAIELVINRAEVPIAGEDILYGQIAKFSIADSLLDGELLDPTSCEKVLGKRSDDQPWQPGCLDIQQRQTPSKGKLTIDQQGNITYVPNGNWHGSDEFNMRVMTTTTRFNDVSNYYITIPTTIVQAPPNNFQSKTVNVGGGSFGIGAIFALFGLLGLRRFKS
ncbi:rhombotarget A [Acinetobacter vivianii]|uniref:Rhombotarget A n=1 Tax=Acinetobacter vivianii TaxID=1776742 RepID=N9NLP2_9GAMM|nr:rhombotarget A [Acinetobacter vivianii]ENX21908.1 rhombotarget A [Acinetobacter vivianii]GGI60826.1 rhombotarget A [Acinetobacter vivianii]